MSYEVQVYICRVQDVPRDWEDQIDSLPASYRTIARSSASERKRKRAFCGGWLLNHIFGPRRVDEIKKDHLGKPYLPSSQVEFSMSHGGDMAVLAVSHDFPLGVDVEQIADAFGPAEEAAARRVFGEEALEELRYAPADWKPFVFARRWTSLEAVLKEQGTGFYVDPRETPLDFSQWHLSHNEVDGHMITCAARSEFTVTVETKRPHLLDASASPSELQARTSGEIERAITDAVFELMEREPITRVRVADVCERAAVSRSTFYRHFKNVDEVVRLFEAWILDMMNAVNKTALKGRFDKHELTANASMVARMEILRANRAKIVTLNGPNGDPLFAHRATVFMHNYLRQRIKDIPASRRDQDLYLSFVVAGHNNLVNFWLEEHPEIPPEYVANMLCKLYYSPFFVDTGEGEEDESPHGVKQG